MLVVCWRLYVSASSHLLLHAERTSPQAYQLMLADGCTEASLSLSTLGFCVPQQTGVRWAGGAPTSHHRSCIDSSEDTLSKMQRSSGILAAGLVRGLFGFGGTFWVQKTWLNAPPLPCSSSPVYVCGAEPGDVLQVRVPLEKRKRKSTRNPPQHAYCKTEG